MRGCRTQTASAKSALLDGQLVLDWHLINMRWELELRELQKHCKQYNARTKHWTQSVLWDGNSYNEQRMLWGYIVFPRFSQLDECRRLLTFQDECISNLGPFLQSLGDVMSPTVWKCRKALDSWKGPFGPLALPCLDSTLTFISLHSSNFSLFSSFDLFRQISSYVGHAYVVLLHVLRRLLKLKRWKLPKRQLKSRHLRSVERTYHVQLQRVNQIRIQSKYYVCI